MPWEGGHEQALECRVPFALLLELSVSLDGISEVDFWTADWPIETRRWFWPVPNQKPVSSSYHSEQCTDYPNCVDQLIAVSNNAMETTPSSDVLYRLLVSIWAFHTLTERLVDNGVPYHVSRPPTLKRICRFRIRQIVNRRFCDVPVNEAGKTDSAMDVQNYSSMVEVLPIPPELKSYLMYSDLWPTTIDIKKIFLPEAQTDETGEIAFTGEEPFGVVS
ncbi:unnamed protein product [Echinostoma caproni]|uniref:SOCS box domain-containing protein n=1 Tax=Echinostoma caproni TaxID=27848 RepID=A0A3P8H411_9TREM|nr:unnamed protein product [Echinostoma caproni]